MATVDLMMTNIDLPRPAFISRQVRDARLFFRDLRPRRPGPLRVVCGGMERCAADYRIDRPGFTYHALELVREGSGTGLWRGQPFRMKAGTVFAYGPQIPHCIAADSARPLVKYFIDFTGHEASALVAPLLRRGPGLCARPDVALLFLEEMIRAGYRPGPSGDKRCAALLRALLLTLADEVSPGAARGEPAVNVTYERVRALMERRAAEIKSLRQLAREAGLDAAYLCRLFRRHGGESPYRALQRLRFGRAAECLLRPGTRVKDAAESIGMSDPYQFSRAFKRIHGLSPRAFQRYRRGEAAEEGGD
jgi:AraC-like DNA-binding protein